MKKEAVAAHASNSTSVTRGSIGVADLSGGLVPEEEERCLANCPADMAKASQTVSASLMLAQSSHKKRWQRGSAGELQH